MLTLLFLSSSVSHFLFTSFGKQIKRIDFLTHKKPADGTAQGPSLDHSGTNQRLYWTGSGNNFPFGTGLHQLPVRELATKPDSSHFVPKPT